METYPKTSMALQEPFVHRLSIKFVGSGQDYFRVWLGNMLLVVVTCGLYWPWAKVRQQRYFFENTLVNGDPLAFHGDPKNMFRGWILIVMLWFVGSSASNYSEIAGAVFFLLIAALWPALWRSSLLFKLHNTSWRGLRFRFTGTLSNAYLTFWPMGLILTFSVFTFLVLNDPSIKPPLDPMHWIYLGFSVLWILAFLWTFWRMKTYQHQNLALASLQSKFHGNFASFILIALKPIVLLGLLFLGGWRLSTNYAPTTNLDLSKLFTYAIYVALAFICIGILFNLGLKPWITTRLQNLFWGNTGHTQFRFISQLKYSSMLGLQVKNTALFFLTLGFYTPFASVSLARLRLESVHILSNTPLNDLLAIGNHNPNEAAGEAAVDYLMPNLDL